MDQKKSLILSFFSSQNQAESRKEGHLTAKFLAEKQGYLLIELNSEKDNTEELLSTISGFIVLNEEIRYPGWKERKERIFSRYLYCNSNLDALQRQFARQGVLRTPYKLSKLGNAEFLENIPCSLIDFEIEKSLYERMRKVTHTQAKLWNKISGDFQFQLECVEK